MRSEAYHPITHWRRHPFRKTAARLTGDPDDYDEDAYREAFTEAFNAAAGGVRDENDLVANDVAAKLMMGDVMHANMMAAGPLVIQAGEALERLLDEAPDGAGGRGGGIPADSFHVAFSGAVDYGRLHGPDHRVGGVYVSTGGDRMMFLVVSRLTKATQGEWPYDEAPALFVTVADRGGTLEEGVVEAILDPEATTRVGWPRGESVSMPFRDAAAIDGHVARLDLGEVARTAKHAIRNAMRIACAVSRRDVVARPGMPDEIDQDLVSRMTGGDQRAVEAITAITERVLLPILYVDLRGNGSRERSRDGDPAGRARAARARRQMGGARPARRR